MNPAITTAPKTLVLTREIIEKTMTLTDYFTAVETAFRRYHEGTVGVPEVGHIPARDGAFHIKSAAFTDKPQYVAVKVNGNFPDNPERHGLPTIQGAITLSDGSNGTLLAILDSIEVTAQRTAAATAVAAKYLANPAARTATIIGCGVQARIQLQALLKVLPLQSVFAFDTNLAAVRQFAETMANATGIEVITLDEFSQGTRNSEVIVTCTSSRKPFLRRQHVQPGTFIAAVGADNNDKQELDERLVAESVVVVDVLEQCLAIGELHHAVDAGLMSPDAVFADLGAVVSGARQHQAGSGKTIIFDSTGSAIQDVAAAGMIYERAVAQGLGLPVCFA